MGGDILPKMEPLTTAYIPAIFSSHINIKVTGMHSNIYTNIIFIGMGVKISVYTGSYPETLFILLKYMQLLPKHP